MATLQVRRRAQAGFSVLRLMVLSAIASEEAALHLIVPARHSLNRFASRLSSLRGKISRVSAYASLRLYAKGLLDRGVKSTFASEARNSGLRAGRVVHGGFLSTELSDTRSSPRDLFPLAPM